MVSLSAIHHRFVGMNTGNDRHSRQQVLQQWLTLVELDSDRDALNHLGEITSRIVGWPPRKLGAAGGGDSLNATVQRLSRESVDGHRYGLAGFDSRQLGFLVVGDDIDT